MICTSEAFNHIFLEHTDVLGCNWQQPDFFSPSNVIHFLEIGERC